MKRVIVVGCPGSGKSRFGRALSEKLGLPVVHLDMIFWQPDGTSLDRDTFDSRLAVETAKDEWIIDGNYSRTMERRLERCDTVFFMDFSTEECLKGVGERMGKPRPDLPCELGDLDDPEFVEYIKGFGETNRPQIVELLEKYKDREIHVFHDREEANEYLESI